LQFDISREIQSQIDCFVPFAFILLLCSVVLDLVESDAIPTYDSTCTRHASKALTRLRQASMVQKCKVFLYQFQENFCKKHVRGTTVPVEVKMRELPQEGCKKFSFDVEMTTVPVEAKMGETPGEGKEAGHGKTEWAEETQVG
jgi:hypothetical protein